jgi:hypothetical protein
MLGARKKNDGQGIVTASVVGRNYASLGIGMDFILIIHTGRASSDAQETSCPKSLWKSRLGTTLALSTGQ